MSSAADAVVVGAGPAGCLAAIVLARAGVRVRLLDRARFPRPKLCGDTLNPGALSLLDRIPLPGARDEDGRESRAGSGRRPGTLGDVVRGRALPISGMTVTGPRGARVGADYPGGLRGAAITRDELDMLLVTCAADAGVVVDDGVRVSGPLVGEAGRTAGVQVSRPHGRVDLRAAIVIAADGRASRLAAAAGLSRLSPAHRRWAFGAYFTGVRGITGHGEMHIRQGGYIGVAPLPGGLVNVCVVRGLTGHTRSRVANARTVLRDAIAGEPMLRDRFSSAEQVSDVTTLGPLAVESRGAGIPGLLLAGDAGGFVDPMTGDGLRFALRGGMLAAEAALSELASGKPACAQLQRARRREFGGKWRLNRALRTLAGSPQGLTVAAQLARAWPSPIAWLIGVAGDVGVAGRNA